VNALIVEDDVEVRRLLRTILATSGYPFEIIEAGSGTDALALVRQHLPDVVLLDLFLPGLDGLQVCRQIKADPATARVPVVLITVETEQGEKERAREAGAEAYLTKPFSPQRLIRMLEQLLGLGPA